MAKTTTDAARILGRKGGQARAKKLTAEQRRAIAQKASAARWKKALDAKNAGA